MPTANGPLPPIHRNPQGPALSPPPMVRAHRHGPFRHDGRMDIHATNLRITRIDAHGTPVGEPMEIEGTMHMSLDDPADVATLTGVPQYSITIGEEQGRMVLTERMDYPDDSFRTLIVPVDGPAPRESGLDS